MAGMAYPAAVGRHEFDAAVAGGAMTRHSVIVARSVGYSRQRKRPWTHRTSL